MIFFANLWSRWLPLHVFFLVLEMFLCDKPLGLKIFRNQIEKARDSEVLAANQGLYNGFLAAGLVWGLFHPNPGFAFRIKAFFLLCVIEARSLWRGDRQPPDPLHAGGARGARPGPALAGITQLRLNQNRGHASRNRYSLHWQNRSAKLPSNGDGRPS
jgi:putative membrane protein